MSLSEWIRESEEKFSSMPMAMRWTLILGAAVVMAMLIWMVWVDPVLKEKEETEQSIQSVYSKIKRLRPSLLTDKILQTRQKKLEMKERIDLIRAQTLYLKSRLSAIDDVRFTQRKFADMLEKILKKSVALGIRIDKIEVESDEPFSVAPLLARIKVLHAEGAGTFASIVTLSWFIESLNPLYAVKNLKIWFDPKKKTLFSMDINIYGMVK